MDIAIPAVDGKTIYGLFNPAQAGKSDALVILAHGLTGRIREFLHIMAMRAFTAAGYDVARIAFYSGGDNARTMHDCTVDLHARDLNTFIDHFRPKYRRIFVAGHSYGGFSLLFANPAVTAVSFWDATWTPGWQHEAVAVPELDCFIYPDGVNGLLGRAMYDEAMYYAANPPIMQAAQFQSPAQVILAQANEKPGRSRHQLFSALSIADKELVWIDGADHQFTTGQTVEALISATQSWFDRHIV